MSGETSKVLLGMTGGVDSSVAAWNLKRDGHEVVGVTLLFHESPTILEKVERARELAAKLGIEHHVVDACKRFRNTVIQHVEDRFAAGFYNNPCTWCTAQLKIPMLFELADEYGCKKLATGHYARVTADEYGVGLLDYQLRSPLDRSKDQTYLLYTLTQEQLARLVFPLEDMHKGVVRRTAMQAGLMRIVPVNDGQGTPCLYGDAPAVEWLEGEGGFAPEEGDVVYVGNYEVVGRHKGQHRYTIGDNVFGKYVIAKDAQRNIVYVGPKSFAAREACEIEDFFWTSVEPLKKKRSCRAKVGLSNRAVPAQLVPLKDYVAVTFNEGVIGVNVGEPVVFYSDDLVLGGGIVAR